MPMAIPSRCVAPRHFVDRGAVHRLTNTGGNGTDPRVQASRDAPLQPPHVGTGDGKVLLPRKQQGDVDRHSRKNRRLDGGHPLGVPGILT